MCKLEERICTNCGTEWKVTVKKEFVNTRRQKFCNDCIKNLTPWQRTKILQTIFPERRDKYIKDKRKEFVKDYIYQIYNRCKRRAFQKNIEFSLTLEDIVIPEICPILEVPLQIGTKNNYEHSPSIDRIDNSKGYIKGNIQIISKKANSMKNSASFEELQTFCKNVLRYSLNNTEEECIELKDKEPLG